MSNLQAAAAFGIMFEGWNFLCKVFQSWKIESKYKYFRLVNVFIHLNCFHVTDSYRMSH